MYTVSSYWWTVLVFLQGHKVQRLDLQEVAKLGKGSDSATAAQDIKQEEQMPQSTANGQADSKDTETSTVAGAPS